MRLRSLLFVPADRPERFAKAVASGADAIILDLEDSVAAERKAFARAAACDWLGAPRDCVAMVRINPLDSPFVGDDLAAILPVAPDALMLPKAEGADSIAELATVAGDRPLPPILPIAAEGPAALFQMGSFATVAGALCGLTWGAEDLSSALGAAASRDEVGRLTPPLDLARSLTLHAAKAAGVLAVETVYPAIGDTAGLTATVARAKRDGFTGMLAIHPSQIEVINRGIAPTPAELDRARAIVAAFAANPAAGALQLDGKMVDRPHLQLAIRALDQAD